MKKKKKKKTYTRHVADASRGRNSKEIQYLKKGKKTGPGDGDAAGGAGGDGDAAAAAGGCGGGDDASGGGGGDGGDDAAGECDAGGGFRVRVGRSLDECNN